MSKETRQPGCDFLVTGKSTVFNDMFLLLSLFVLVFLSSLFSLLSFPLFPFFSLIPLFSLPLFPLPPPPPRPSLCWLRDVGGVLVFYAGKGLRRREVVGGRRGRTLGWLLERCMSYNPTAT